MKIFKKFFVVICLMFVTYSVTSCSLITIIKPETKPFIPGDELHIIAIEMTGKYGDSFIIKYNNFEMLVDAGTKEDSENVQVALDEFVADDELDILMVSHLHADHIGSMTDVSFFEDLGINVKKIVDAGTKPTSKTAENYVSMREEFVKNGATYYPYYDILNGENIEKTWHIDEEGKLFIEFFDTGEVSKVGGSPSDLNASSIAFTICYNENKWFFAGDLPSFCEEELVKNMKKSDPSYFKESDCVVYKSCHHGSKSSNGDLLLSFVKPDIIFTMSGIVSSNRENSKIVDQHPYLETLERMKKYTEKIYWSSINGLTIFSSKGYDVSISSRGRTIDYYYNGLKVSREEEKDVTIFESKWYEMLKK